MLRDVPIRYLLVLGFLASGLVPVMAVSLASLSTARGELAGQAMRQLESVRDLQRSRVERLFEDRVRQVEVLASDPYVAGAMREFRALAERRGGFGALALAAGVGGGFAAAASYRELHDRHFPWFHLYAERLGDYDVFLMDPDQGFTLFTVKKEADFGVPVAGLDSPLRDVWREAREGRIALSDTRLYAPSLHVPAQFVAAPVYEDGRLAGVVAVQVGQEALDRLMGERSGLGESGEAYLVGPDLRMRSASRLDPEGRSVPSSFAGPVATRGADTEAVREALSGGTGSRTAANYRGDAVLTAFAPVRVAGLRWALVADIASSEIEARIAAALEPRILGILGLAIALVALLAWVVSVVIARGVRQVLAQLGVLIDEVLRGRLHARVPVGEAPVDFRDVVARTNHLVDAFAAQVEERRRWESAVQFNQRMEAIGTLAGGIAHDFNNILTYMANYTALLDRALPEGSPAREYLPGIDAGIDRAGGLVAQLLAFGRKTGRERVPVALNRVVRDALKLVKASIPKEVRLVRALPEDDVPVLSDPTHLHQIVMNLCTNALQAMEPDGGTMTVTLVAVDLDPGPDGLPPGRYARLDVGDTGCGMDAPTLARVFEPFFTTKPVGRGTGMGLAVVHGLVRQAGGSIAFESAPGRGTTARVLLPLHATAPGDPAAEAAVPVPGDGRLLFVDDEAEIGASAARVLESLGYEVRVEASAAGAEAAFAAEPDAWDAVLTDLAMPGMSGLELARRVRAIRPGTPVLVTTGYADRVTPEEATAAGATALVLKPYAWPDLSRRIRDAVEAARSARQARVPPGTG